MEPALFEFEDALSMPRLCDLSFSARVSPDGSSAALFTRNPVDIFLTTFSMPRSVELRAL
jgi:hypothetical protein